MDDNSNNGSKTPDQQVSDSLAHVKMSTLGVRISGVEAYLEGFQKVSATLRLEQQKHEEQLNG